MVVQSSNDWFNRAEMPKVTSRDQFYALFEAKKHIFIEFFSPSCRYCALFLDEFNRIYHYMQDTYEQVEIYSLNGAEFPDLVSRHAVPYFPYFVYIAPFLGEGPAPKNFASRFLNQPRNYQSMIGWMVSSA
jgi:hypothetical protein